MRFNRRQYLLAPFLYPNCENGRKFPGWNNGLWRTRQYAPRHEQGTVGLIEVSKVKVADKA